MKKSEIIEQDVVENLLRKFNPFGLRSKQGVPYEFVRVSDSYLTLMVRVYTSFPRGYVELPLLIHELYNHLSPKECMKVAESMASFGLEMIELIDYQGKEGKRKLESICRSLHHLCDTTFDNASFLEAYRLFQNRLEIDKVKKSDGK